MKIIKTETGMQVLNANSAARQFPLAHQLHCSQLIPNKREGNEFMSKMMSKLFVLIVLVASIPAFAGVKGTDETVLINQASVQAAGGFPFIISQPGSYKLIGNLVVPANTSGILVQSNDVTLDLNGFSITGAIVCDNGGNNCSPTPTVETKGVEAILGTVNGQASNIFGVTIKNGHVRGFTFGISTFGGIVEEITAQSNLTAGIQAFDAVVRRNDASRNHGDGIACNQCVVTDNIAAFNQTNNFHLVFGGVFASNTAVGAGFGASLDIFIVSVNNNSCNGTRC